MGCDKRYGLRDVWVAPEASQNAPAVFENINYLQHCTASSFPAVYRQNLDNQEATGNRGQSVAFDGSQNELAWDLTVMLPDSAAMATPASLPESLQALFWAAGFGSASGPANWTSGASSVVMGMTAGSTCGRTIQIAGLDRDRRQLELLTGAVVSQVVFNFSRTDVCTVQFSGVASQKFEATAPEIAPASLSATKLAAITHTSFDVDLSNSPATLSGIELTLPGAAQDVTIIHGDNFITLADDLSSSTITAATQSYFSIAKPSSFYSVLKPEEWSVNSAISAAQSATITLTTGNSYGELTTDAKWPVEIVSGQVQVAAALTAYLTDGNLSALNTFGNGAQFSVYLQAGQAGKHFDIKHAKLTERPALDLSAVDSPASGDFNLQGGETGTNLANGFLDTIYLS